LRVLSYPCLFLGLLLFLVGCSQSETGIEGTLQFIGQPLNHARVEFYLKSGTERSSTPFSVATSDQSGRFYAQLPAGKYYVISKKKEQGGGVNRMLMAEYPHNPVIVTKGMAKLDVLELKEVGSRGTIASDGKTQIRGQLQFQADPLGDAFVYVYIHGGALTGPAYGQVVQADTEGNFVLNLSAGQYWLAARKRSDGSRAGDPKVGDLTGIYPDNPLVLKTGDQRRLKPWNLKVVSQAAKEKRLQQGKFTPTSVWVEGRVVDEDQQPLAGIYLFVYEDSRMIGKPSFISPVTGADGLFRIYVEEGGKYYIGARSTFGGPLEPGEWVGTFDAQPDHGVDVAVEGGTELGDIPLHEVW